MNNPPAHFDLFVDYIDRLEKGEKNVTQAQYIERAGCNQSSLSQAFSRCSDYFDTIDTETKRQLLARANRNIAQSAIIGTANRLRINMKAAENLAGEDKVDFALQNLSESMVKDNLDRTPATSKKGAEIQILNLQQTNIKIPNLLSDDVKDVKEELGGMLADTEQSTEE